MYGRNLRRCEYASSKQQCGDEDYDRSKTGHRKRCDYGRMLIRLSGNLVLHHVRRLTLDRNGQCWERNGILFYASGEPTRVEFHSGRVKND